MAPTKASRTVVDRPLAVVDGVNTASPATWFVHVDHLNRPIRMTDAAKTAVWTAVWQPWGAPHNLTGPATLNTRFPGQWFQLEAGLHYNWHRHYDPGLGRYTQPDPLGFVDGASVYGYARGGPHRLVDRDGRNAALLPWCLATPANMAICGLIITAPPIAAYCYSTLTQKKTESPPPPPDDDDRCKAIIRGCKAGCTDIYVDDPDSLPGSGRNYQPRWTRCVKNCAKAQGCAY